MGKILHNVLSRQMVWSPQVKEQWSWQEYDSVFLLTLCVSMAESLNLDKPVLPLQNNAVFHNTFLRIKHF